MRNPDATVVKQSQTSTAISKEDFEKRMQTSLKEFKADYARIYCEGKFVINVTDVTTHNKVIEKLRTSFHAD